jgi:alpha/beta superfamily hydrolase
VTRRPLREIPGPAGRLEALLEPAVVAPGARERAAVVFAHPHPLHGGTMHTKAVYRATKALASLGCAVLRFNFRGVGKSEGMFDNAVGELDDFRAGLDFVAAHYPDTELWAAGFSFGAYVALTAGARDARVTTLIGIAPALQMYDFSEVRTSVKPKYFVQGERDEICPLPYIQAFFAELSEPKALAVIPGATHLFTGKVEELGRAIVAMLGAPNERSLRLAAKERAHD